MKNAIFILLFSMSFISCKKTSDNTKENVILDRAMYQDQLEGFWLGQCIANWTGLITEMDKIGIPSNGMGEGFYTREDWGKKDHPNIW